MMKDGSGERRLDLSKKKLVGHRPTSHPRSSIGVPMGGPSTARMVGLAVRRWRPRNARAIPRRPPKWRRGWPSRAYHRRILMEVQPTRLAGQFDPGLSFGARHRGRRAGGVVATGTSPRARRGSPCVRIRSSRSDLARESGQAVRRAQPRSAISVNLMRSRRRSPALRDES